MITLLGWHVARNIWVATLKVKVTAWPCTVFCPAHNFVIWSPILKLFHRNDHYIETPCGKQNLGRYLDGQGHIITLKQKQVLPITLLFEGRIYK